MSGGEWKDQYDELMAGSTGEDYVYEKAHETRSEISEATASAIDKTTNREFPAKKLTRLRYQTGLGSTNWSFGSHKLLPISLQHPEISIMMHGHHG